MNEEMLKALYSKLGLEGKTDFNTFKNDMSVNADMHDFIFNKLELGNKGVTLDQFQKDLGFQTNPLQPEPKNAQDFFSNQLKQFTGQDTKSTFKAPDAGGGFMEATAIGLAPAQSKEAVKESAKKARKEDYDERLEENSKKFYENNAIINNPNTTESDKKLAVLNSLDASRQLLSVSSEKLKNTYGVDLGDFDKLEYKLKTLNRALEQTRVMPLSQEEKELRTADITNDIQETQQQLDAFTKRVQSFPELEFLQQASEARKFLTKESEKYFPEIKEARENVKSIQERTDKISKLETAGPADEIVSTAGWLYGKLAGTVGKLQDLGLSLNKALVEATLSGDEEKQKVLKTLIEKEKKEGYAEAFTPSYAQGSFEEEQVSLQSGKKAVIKDGQAIFGRDKNGYKVDLSEDEIKEASSLNEQGKSQKTYNGLALANNFAQVVMDMVPTIALTRGLGATSKVGSALTIGGSTAAQSFGGYYFDALEKGKSGSSAFGIALAKASADGILENIGGLEARLAGVGVDDVILRSIKQETAEKIASGKLLSKDVLEYYSGRVKDSVGESLKQGVGETFEEFSQSFSQGLVDLYTMNDRETLNNIPKEGLETFLITMALGAGSTSIQDATKWKAETRDDILYNSILFAIDNPDKVSEVSDLLKSDKYGTGQTAENNATFISILGDDLQELGIKDDKKRLLALQLLTEMYSIKSSSKNEKSGDIASKVRSKKIKEIEAKLNALSGKKIFDTPEGTEVEMPEDEETPLRDGLVDFMEKSPKADDDAVKKQETLDSFIERITKGEDMTSPEDQQFYDNNKKEIEQILQKKATESIQIKEEDDNEFADLADELGIALPEKGQEDDFSELSGEMGIAQTQATTTPAAVTPTAQPSVTVPKVEVPTTTQPAKVAPKTTLKKAKKGDIQLNQSVQWDGQPYRVVKMNKDGSFDLSGLTRTAAMVKGAVIEDVEFEGILEIQDDKENVKGVPGQKQVGQEPVQTQPNQGAGQEAPATGGVLQTQKEVTPVRKAITFNKSGDVIPVEVLSTKNNISSVRLPNGSTTLRVSSELFETEEDAIKHLNATEEIEPQEGDEVMHNGRKYVRTRHGRWQGPTGRLAGDVLEKKLDTSFESNRLRKVSERGTLRKESIPVDKKTQEKELPKELRDDYEDYSVKSEEFDPSLEVTSPQKPIPPTDQIAISKSLEEKIDFDKETQTVDLGVDVSEIQDVLKELNDNGNATFIVGGGVRDVLLGQNPKDIDVEVHGLELSDLLKVLSKYGTAKEITSNTQDGFTGIITFVPKNGTKLSEPYEFSVPRTETSTGVGKGDFAIKGGKDVGKKQAFERRENTINAIGYNPITKELYNPFNGLNDLKNKELNLVSDAFKEDPSRVVRTMQFMSRFGFKPSEAMYATIREMVESGAVDSVPKELWGKNFDKMMSKGKDFTFLFEFLEKSGVGAKFFPELMELTNTKQDPKWHPEGTVSEHTSQVMQKAFDIAERDGIEGDDRLVLMYAALLHDIAKPQTTFVNDKGDTVSPGHEAAGVEPAKAFLEKIKAPNAIIARVLPLVKEHLVHSSIHALPKVVQKKSAFRKLQNRLNEKDFRGRVQDLLWLMEADMLGRNNANQEAPQGLFEMYWLKENLGETKPVSLLQGRDLILRGMKPGLAFKKYLDKAQALQDNQVLLTKEDADNWLDERIRLGDIDSFVVPQETKVPAQDPTIPEGYEPSGYGPRRVKPLPKEQFSDLDTKEKLEKVEDVARKIKSALSELVPGLKIFGFATTKEYREYAESLYIKYGLSTKAARERAKKSRALYDPNTKTVLFDHSKISDVVLFHEATHPVMAIVESMQPGTIDKMFSELEELEKELGITGRFTVNFAGKYKGHVTNRDQKEEAIVQFIAEVSAGKVDLSKKTVLQKVIDLLNRFLKLFNKEIKTNAKESDVKKLAKELSSAFNSGMRVSSKNFNYTGSVRKTGRLFSTPVKDIARIAKKYKEENGIQEPDGVKIYEIDENTSKRIADEFEVMKHDPLNEDVKNAYAAMAEEVVKQFEYLLKEGYTIEVYNGVGEPYENSQEMLKDLGENKHLYILSTKKEFGENPITEAQIAENPLLKETKYIDRDGDTFLVNDIFRAVHDAFGHGERGNSFGPKGEENAWDVHARMFTPLARRAMTSETRGQNSWVNFGKHLRNKDGSIRYVDPKEKPYAEQKIGLLPEWVSTPIDNTGIKMMLDDTDKQIALDKFSAYFTTKGKPRTKEMADKAYSQNQAAMDNAGITKEDLYNALGITETGTPPTTPAGVQAGVEPLEPEVPQFVPQVQPPSPQQVESEFQQSVIDSVSSVSSEDFEKNMKFVELHDNNDRLAEALEDEKNEYVKTTQDRMLSTMDRALSILKGRYKEAYISKAYDLFRKMDKRSLNTTIFGIRLHEVINTELKNTNLSAERSAQLKKIKKSLVEDLQKGGKEVARVLGLYQRLKTVSGQNAVVKIIANTKAARKRISEIEQELATTESIEQDEAFEKPKATAPKTSAKTKKTTTIQSMQRAKTRLGKRTSTASLSQKIKDLLNKRPC